MTNPWQASKLPKHAAAVLGALHLDDPRPGACEWEAALEYADRERLTLVWRNAARAEMPEAVRARVDSDAAKNQLRLRGIEEACRDLASWLSAGGIEYVLLKGITHAEVFAVPAESRVQYDLDLWLPREQAHAAQALLMTRGYQPLPGTDDLPTDHLPALARKTGWQWRGDFFDPEIPLPVELHFQFWNSSLERFSAPGVEAFWARRVTRPLAGTTLPALYPADAVAFAALHVLKHVLGGSVRVFHVYEIAAMLQARAADTAFWSEWHDLHPAGLRMLQAIVFRLAHEWFGGTAAAAVEEEIARLPANIQTWFDEFSASPAMQTFQANKDYLWLHLCLLDAGRDRWAIAGGRLFPRRLPTAAGDSFVARQSWREWLRWRWRWLAFACGRARHHAAALPATLLSGVRWWRRVHS